MDRPPADRRPFIDQSPKGYRWGLPFAGESRVVRLPPQGKPGRRPSVKCGACRGCGEAPLSDALWQVLRLLRVDGPATATEVHMGIGIGFITVGAFNNRLEDLRAFGLVARRRRDGKTFVYAARTAPPGKERP